MLRSTRSWIEISKTSLVHNINVFRKTVGKGVKVMTVVKSNAYGHGVQEISNILENTKNVNWFGVDSITEAINLRLSGINKPILVLGYTPFFKLKETFKYKISITVYDVLTLKKLTKLKSKVNIHLKIDTGMGRQGLKDSEINSFLDLLVVNKNINLEGVFTHFASADEEDPDFTYLQIENFNKVLKMINQRNFFPQIIHSAATSGTAMFRTARFNLVRAGIGIYGLFPSEYVKSKKSFNIKPILSWKCYIAKIKTIKQGESVGYGRAWKAKDDSKIALVPVGYFDGYDRKLSNLGKVIVRGVYAPIIGRVSMNMMSIDVTNIPNIKLEDEVILIGRHGGIEISADDIAREIGTINYEVVTRINSQLPRFVT